jgi:hypothetical protein
MPDTTPSSPASAALDEIKDRAAVFAKLGPPRSAHPARGIGAESVNAGYASAADVPRLVAAIEAVLEGHEPMPTYGAALNPDGSSACGHDPDDGRHFEVSAGELVCQGDPGPPVCARCSDTLLDDGEAEWPCGIYVAVARELAEEAGDGTS